MNARCNCTVLATRRGFLAGLGALGAGALLPGCQSAAPAVAAGKPHRIDIHHHLVPPAYAKTADGLPGVRPPRWSPQMSLEDMDKNGIATAVLALMQPAAAFDRPIARDLARLSNEYAAQVGRDHPGRFGSFATLPLLDVEGSLREIAYAFDTLRADGIGLMTSYQGKYLGDRHFWPIWEELNRRRAVIYTHPLDPACCVNVVPDLPGSSIEYGTDTTRTIASLVFGGGAARFPEIRWIFSHSGGTMPFLWSRFTRQVVDMKERAQAVLPNGLPHEIRKFYYDTAQGHHEGAMYALRQLVPTSQIMFGSDFPYRLGAEVREGLAARSFSAAERMAIDRGNAMRIMPGLKTVA